MVQPVGLPRAQVVGSGSSASGIGQRTIHSNFHSFGAHQLLDPTLLQPRKYISAQVASSLCQMLQPTTRTSSFSRLFRLILTSPQSLTTLLRHALRQSTPDCLCLVNRKFTEPSMAIRSLWACSPCNLQSHCERPTCLDWKHYMVEPRKGV